MANVNEVKSKLSDYALDKLKNSLQEKHKNLIMGLSKRGAYPRDLTVLKKSDFQIYKYA